MKKKYIGLLYLTPWMIGILFFVVYPFAMSLFYSFTDYSMLTEPKFIGFDNYIKMFTDDPIFWSSVKATIKFVFLTVPFKLIFALFVAYVMNAKLKGIGFFRTAYYIPSILGANVAIAVLWQFLFKNDGLVNMMLNSIGLANVAWFSSGTGAMLTIVLLRVWQFGSAMVIFLNALTEMPQDLYEAAAIDGASKFRQFFSVTLPQLTPIIFFNLILQLVQAFQEFDGPFLITGGGPMRSTYLLPMYIYDNAFKIFNMGYSSALSWVLFVMIMIFTAILFKTSKNWVFYADGRG
ncbi:carbohydrate ABC transporter permease [Enterococcus thailandicus]|uniref:Sugar ABC transporter permease n=1 Tax=Enterococcus thailandicus TaxID=417368 RepID=A0A179ETS1_ENTTH|nr:sugar ABC transporter permease [Enterococcus thailandicus]OAQ56604.1 sugar ABC transporter permease [Enterococcus thailandicus]